MTNGLVVPVTAAVEGLLDEAVAARVIDAAGGIAGRFHGNRRGVNWLLGHLSGYNHAAAYSPWLVLVDLDDGECAPQLRASVLPDPAVWMCFRIAVRAVEAWLLADDERLAQFLSVPSARIPADPDSLRDPKGAMLQVASASRRRIIRDSMLPYEGSGSRTGAAYTGTLLQFVQDPDSGWRPTVAAQQSESLARCLACLSDRISAYGDGITAA